MSHREPWVKNFVSQCVASITDPTYRRRLEGELADHLEELAANLEESGLSPDEARERALEEMAKYKEVNLFLRGIVPMIGFKTDVVTYERHERMAGESKYPLKKMLALAFNGISSFSVKPISMILGAGMIIVALSLLAAIYALISYCTGHVVPGWTSLILSIWFLGGIQLMAIGLVGQYIGKIYIEVKHRPRYNIEKVLK